MYQTGNDFLAHYEWESATTQKVLNALTDASLTTSKGEGQHNLGQIAWHIATAFGYMTQCDWDMPEFSYQAPSGLTARQIQDTFAEFTARVKEVAAGKNSDDLLQRHVFFGHYDWSLDQMLSIMVSHEIHHRGQVSVLMRQAGLIVPSIYGPNAEETAEMMSQTTESQQGG